MSERIVRPFIFVQYSLRIPLDIGAGAGTLVTPKLVAGARGAFSPESARHQAEAQLRTTNSLQAIARILVNRAAKFRVRLRMGIRAAATTILREPTTRVCPKLGSKPNEIERRGCLVADFTLQEGWSNPPRTGIRA